MVEFQPSKLAMRVRFPSPALATCRRHRARRHGLVGWHAAPSNDERRSQEACCRARWLVRQWTLGNGGLGIPALCCAGFSSARRSTCFGGWGARELSRRLRVNHEPILSDAEVIVASLGRPEACGAIVDRHATALHRYLVRRVGVDAAEVLLGELFRVAFERRYMFDPQRSEARPWLYGIASRLLGHDRRSEARRLRAMARLAPRPPRTRSKGAAEARLDPERLWPHVADAVARLPGGERDALLLYAWEDLTYHEIATALAVPVGTVRSPEPGPAPPARTAGRERAR
jgi:RNA polymerase sigma factor (sigma-70 family)